MTDPAALAFVRSPYCLFLALMRCGISKRFRYADSDKEERARGAYAGSYCGAQKCSVRGQNKEENAQAKRASIRFSALNETERRERSCILGGRKRMRKDHMNKKTQYTAAVIGTGRIGFTLGFDRRREQPASHTMALKQNRRIKIIAGCDMQAANLAFWHRFVKDAAAYDNYSHLFASCKPDIAVIAVNENAHLEAALAAIRARPRLVILEKPVALSVADGERIEEEALAYGVPVMVNHERRFAVDYARARSYLKRIGSLMSVTARLDSGLCVYAPDLESSGEYGLWHDGTHLVDCVMYLLEDGGASSRAAAALRNIQISSIYYDEKDRNAVRNLNVHCCAAACPDINLHFSGRSRYFCFEIDLIGTEGRITIGNGVHRFYCRKASTLYTGFYSLSEDKKIRIPKKSLYFSNMIQNALDFLDGMAPLRSPLETGMNALRVLEQIKVRAKLFKS